MKKETISCNVTVEGQAFHCPAKLMIGRQEEGLLFGGIVQWNGRPVRELIKKSNQEIENQIGVYMDGLLPRCSVGEVSLLHRKNFTTLKVQEKGLSVQIAMTTENTAVLFSFQMEQNPNMNSDASVLLQALKKVADFFGIQKLFFYAQTGKQWLLPMLKPEETIVQEIPQQLKNSSFLVYAQIQLNSGNVFQNALKTLFHLHETTFLLGGEKNAFFCVITIPSFDTKIMKGENMYMIMQLASKTSIVLKGEFIFQFLKDVCFHIDCAINTESVALQAWTQMETPIPLFGPFSIGDTCLMIKVSATGLTFGMYSNLYIRKIQIFGALMLHMKGEMIEPQLLSAAISDLSIPILLENLLNEEIPGIEALNFIKILGFTLPEQTFPKDVIEQKNLSAIVEQFNRQIHTPSLELDPNQVQLTSFQGGLNLSDQKRMRQYYISPSGTLQLMAQFYYSTVTTQLGSYNVEPGLFICGVIELFGKQFEVLFSFQEKEGVLAYAKIPKMDLGVLQIGPSQLENNNTETLPIAEDSVLKQFLAHDGEKGLVFFLSARKKDISFYFDGNITILSLFSADARIIFCKGMISVDLQVQWLLLQISLHLKVEYKNFSSGNFEFCLMIDTSKLTEKLQSITANIENAIGKLQAKIADAKREIDKAQLHVNELYGQIEGLNQKINKCRDDIRNASWWKKAFVAIAKGIEIGAYEVAKAGVYAAIGVATAALQVAKGIVDLGGKVGEGVLKAVNAVIKGAMSLFYINYITLTAKADTKEQYFQAEIEFVALGKTYKYGTKIGKTALSSNQGAALTEAINEKLQPDLDHIEDGAFKSIRKKCCNKIESTQQHCERLDGARKHMVSSVHLIQSVQDIYMEEFQVPMEEIQDINISLLDAFSYSENLLSTGVKTGSLEALGDSMKGLKEKMEMQKKNETFHDSELSKIKELIMAYEEAKQLHDEVTSTLDEVKSHRASIEVHSEQMKEGIKKRGSLVVNGSDSDFCKVLSEVEKQVYEDFPVNRSGKDFINLSREPLLQECFIQAEQEIGRVPNEKIKKMRKRSRVDNYQPRL